MTSEEDGSLPLPTAVAAGSSHPSVVSHVPTAFTTCHSGISPRPPKDEEVPSCASRSAQPP